MRLSPSSNVLVGGTKLIGIAVITLIRQNSEVCHKTGIYDALSITAVELYTGGNGNILTLQSSSQFPL